MFVWRRGAVLLLVLGACKFHTNGVSGDATDAPAPITVGFETATSGADEKSGTVMIPVVLSAPADGPIDITYAVTGGTATPGVDFTVSSTTLSFAAGETMKSIPVAIVDDTDETEPNETVDLGIAAASGALLGTATTHEITISNHILPRVSFAMTATSASEATPTMLTLTLDKPAEVDSTVQLSLGPTETAAPGADFGITDNQVVSIPTGSMTVAVPMGEVNDALDEDDETVIVTLKNPSLGLLVGTNNTLTHTIIDDDAAPSIGFSAATSSVAESVGTTQLTVALSAPSGKTITVVYNVDGASTATPGVDATVVGAGGTLTFAPGETTKTIDVTVVDDALNEVDETVIVQLSNASNATLASGTHTLTITDNDPAPSASFDPTESDQAVAEGDPNPTFHDFTYHVVLNTASSKSVTAVISFGGDAVNPDDYSVTTGLPIVFAPGEVKKAITLRVVADNAPDIGATDVITMTLTSAGLTNATLGSPAVRTHTIINDDGE